MILALSDTHGLLQELDLSGIDRIMIAGDVCPTSNHTEQFQRRCLERSFFAWVEYLKVPVYLALGNHDFIDDFTAPDNLHYGTQTIIDDVLLFSWVPYFYNWAWMTDDEDIANRLEKVLASGSPPIWITHGPPYGVCDETGSEHSGSTALLAAIQCHSPQYVICGHLHEGKQFGKIGDTTVINASLLNDRYEKVREPVVIPAT